MFYNLHIEPQYVLNMINKISISEVAKPTTETCGVNCDSYTQQNVGNFPKILVAQSGAKW